MLKLFGPTATIDMGYGRMEVAQDTTDLQSWDVYFAPEDDIHAIVLAELQKAAALAPKVECYSSQYGFTDQDVADCFKALGKNLNSRFLFDKTQEAGTKERPIVQDLVTNLQDTQWAVGTSSKAHQILHTKAISLLHPDGTGWTVTGSFNLSASAEQQFNIVDVTRSRSRAQLFAVKIGAMFDWVKTNEGQNKP